MQRLINARLAVVAANGYLSRKEKAIRNCLVCTGNISYPCFKNFQGVRGQRCGLKTSGNIIGMSIVGKNCALSRREVPKMKTNHAEQLREALHAITKPDRASFGYTSLSGEQWRQQCYMLASEPLDGLGYSDDEISAALLRELGGEVRRHPGRPSETDELKLAVSVMLTRSSMELARLLGDGNASKGIRVALRQSEDNAQLRSAVSDCLADLERPDRWTKDGAFIPPADFCSRLREALPMETGGRLAELLNSVGVEAHSAVVTRDKVEEGLRADLDAARREIADLTSRLDQLESRLDATEAEVM